ncbi:hypothetical protein COOONC_00671 [Cooperia oncophora]
MRTMAPNSKNSYLSFDVTCASPIAVTLADSGTVCKGCTEKSEYVKKIEELKPKYVKEEL